jgi:hypothetical protein
MIEILTMLLVIITGIYAWFTFKILKANEKIVERMHEQQEAMYRPYITISPVVYPDHPVAFLRIQNSGLSAANNLRLTLDKDFFQFGDKKEERNLKSHSAFKDKICSLAPGAEIYFYLAQSTAIFGEKGGEDLTPSVFSVTAEYEYLGKKVSENTVVDLCPYLGAANPHDPLVKQLKDIKEIIEKKKFS